MISVKEIPKKLYIRDKSVYKKKVAQSEEISNSFISGIVLSENPHDSNRISAFDPRGFSCTIENIPELLKHITIRNGVIEDDLKYILINRNTRGESWALVTEDMLKETGHPISSLKDLKVGEVYLYYRHKPVIYAGIKKWRTSLGYSDITTESAHTLIDINGRSVFRAFKPSVSEFISLPNFIPDPDLFSEAMEKFNSSFVGNPDAKMMKLELSSDSRPDGETFYPYTRGDDLRNIVNRLGWGSVALFGRQVNDRKIEFIIASPCSINPTMPREEALRKTTLVLDDKNNLCLQYTSIGKTVIDENISSLMDWTCFGAIPDFMNKTGAMYRKAYVILSTGERLLLADNNYNMGFVGYHFKF